MNYEIKRFIEERNIESLFHFTPVDNLENILKYGLLSINNLNRLGIDYYYNDENRYDDRLDAISTSIEFPNYKMFYKCRQESGDANWCVIELDASVLVDKDCIFNIENAAKNRERYRSYREKSGIRGLEALFYGDGIRYELELPTYFTTNPQAEVQVLDKIEVNYIKAVHFENYESKNFFDKHIEYKYNIKSKVTEGLFRWRCDYKYWKKVG